MKKVIFILLLFLLLPCSIYGEFIPNIKVVTHNAILHFKLENESRTASVNLYIGSLGADYLGLSVLGGLSLLVPHPAAQALGLTLLVGTPYFAPYTHFEVKGPYTYQNYPFESENGYLVRSLQKSWSGHTDYQYLSNQDDPGWALRSELFWDRFGIKGAYRKLGGFKIKEGAISYQFARNDFFVFTTGIGYQYISSTLQGPGWHYGLDFFYDGVHLSAYWSSAFDSWSITSFSNFSTFSKMEMGYLFDRFEMNLGYYWQTVRNTFSFSGPIAGVRVWY